MILKILKMPKNPPPPRRERREGKMSEDAENDYLKYRGKCKELSENAVKADSSLILCRGHYYDFLWGEQAHWWCKKKDGTIVDLTKDQFPSKGSGKYVEFNGI